MPEPGMRIPITVPGARQAAQDIASIGRAAGGAAAEQVKLEKSLGNLAASASRMRVQAEGVVARTARSPAFFEAQRVAGASREAREQARSELAEAVRAKREQDRETAQLERGLRVRGPTQRLSTAQGAFATAMAKGDKDAAQDAEFAIARARVGIQRGRHQLARTGGGGFAERLTGVLSSSRLNLGPISPLVGQAAEALGVPAVGPVAAGLAGAGIALSAFVNALRTASAHLNEIGEAARLTGGRPQDIGGLTAFGLRGGQAAGAAAGFQARISGGDAFATATAAQHGFFNLPRPFGNVNEAKGLRAALEYLRSIRNEGEQLRQARILGLEDQLRYVRAGSLVQDVLKRQADAEEALARSGGPAAANDLAIATESLTVAWGQLLAGLGTPTVRAAADAVSRLSQAASTIGKFGAEHPTLGSGVAGVLEGILPGGIAAALLGIGGGEDDEGTKATRDLNDTMKQTNGILKGSAGLGPRGERAIPPGWSGGQLRQGMDAGVIRRGQIFQ